MLKKLFVLLISVIQLNLIIAQNKDFVGRILYKNTFLSPKGVDITSKVAGVLGAEQDYYINGRDYKSVCNGTAITMQVYKNESNKYYMILPNKTAQVMDGSGKADSILSITHVKTDTLILGRKCKSVVVKESKTTTTYFYDSTLTINKDNFKKHNLGNFNRYLQESNGALPIKYIVVSQAFTWDAEATKIEELKLTDKDFELGADIQIKE
jgi:hypothetical protein